MFHFMSVLCNKEEHVLVAHLFTPSTLHSNSVISPNVGYHLLCYVVFCVASYKELPGIQLHVAAMLIAL